MKTAGKGHRKTRQTEADLAIKFYTSPPRGRNAKACRKVQSVGREISQQARLLCLEASLPTLLGRRMVWGCSGDTAHGRGVLHWSGADSSSKEEGTGEIVHGKLQATGLGAMPTVKFQRVPLWTACRTATGHIVRPTVTM